MSWLLILLATAVIGGVGDSDIILVNETGLPIARIEIDHRKFDVNDSGLPPHNKVLISASPSKHHLRLIFRGGAQIAWPDLNFANVHEIFFHRSKNKIEARIE